MILQVPGPGLRQHDGQEMKHMIDDEDARLSVNKELLLFVEALRVAGT
jgi:hypothetical protein